MLKDIHTELNIHDDFFLDIKSILNKPIDIYKNSRNKRYKQLFNDPVIQKLRIKAQYIKDNS